MAIVVSEDDVQRRLIAEAERDLARREAAAPASLSGAQLAAFLVEHSRLAAWRRDVAARGDAAADDRDSTAEKRDLEAAQRDEIPQLGSTGEDPGRAARLMSAQDRGASATDRRDAGVDRQNARSDRHQAAGALEVAGRATDTSGQELATLWEAINTRTAIGQATGILIERYTLSPDHAFQMIAKLSQDMNVKVSAVADMIIDATTAPPR